MKQLFRFKAKIYYFVSCAFYLLFFIVGFFVGGGSIEKMANIISNMFK